MIDKVYVLNVYTMGLRFRCRIKCDLDYAIQCANDVFCCLGHNVLVTCGGKECYSTYSSEIAADKKTSEFIKALNAACSDFFGDEEEPF